MRAQVDPMTKPGTWRSDASHNIDPTGGSTDAMGLSSRDQDAMGRSTKPSDMSVCEHEGQGTRVSKAHLGELETSWTR